MCSLKKRDLLQGWTAVLGPAEIGYPLCRESEPVLKL
jgi:hypothetical protein